MRTKRSARRIDARRNGAGRRHRGRPPLLLLILPAVLLLFGIAVGVGNCLRASLAAYEESKRLEQYIPPREEIITTAVGEIQAKHYKLNTSLPAGTALSVTVRAEDGTLQWHSATDKALGQPAQSSTDLAGKVAALHQNGSYLSACFAVTSQKEENRGVREIYESYEIALLRELADAGVDEIVLTDLDVTEQTVEEVQDFLYRIKTAIGTAPLGVALPYSTVSRTQSGVYLAAAVRSVCDFLLLDLRTDRIGANPDGDAYTPDEIFDLCQYDIHRFSMRLLLDKDTAYLCERAEERGIRNWQIAE